jgi:hypothetical protein
LSSQHLLVKRKTSATFLVFALLSISILGCLSGCGEGILSRSKEEGILEFDTRGVDPKHPLYILAPSSATMKFKGDKFAIEMSIMGLFNTTILADNAKKTVAQTVKFLDIKQACIDEEAALVVENAANELQIEETEETKDILGFKCYKAKVRRKAKPSVAYNVWYTKELGKENCNALTPYHQIKGLLMDYRVERMGMELHFVAKKFTPEALTDNTFELPASMKIVSRAEMEKLLKDLQ